MSWYWPVCLIIHLIFSILALTPFLPGPVIFAREINTVFSALQLSSLSVFLVSPIALIWIILKYLKKKNDADYLVPRIPLLLVTLPATLFVATKLLSEPARGFSRDHAIKKAIPITDAIDSYFLSTGAYPESLDDLVPRYIDEIPTPGIIGIRAYDYRINGKTYLLEFYQNVNLGFNFEIVAYDPTNNHTAEGELTALHETGTVGWKYYIYD